MPGGSHLRESPGFRADDQADSIRIFAVLNGNHTRTKNQVIKLDDFLCRTVCVLAESVMIRRPVSTLTAYHKWDTIALNHW